MYITYRAIKGEIPIVDYEVTPKGDIILHLESNIPKAPNFVRLSLPEAGGIVLKLLFYFTRR